MPRLIVFSPHGATFTVETFSPSAIKDGSPTFEFLKTIMGLPQSVTLETLQIQYEGSSAWLFCDEEGRPKGLAPNKAATAVFKSFNPNLRKDFSGFVGPVAIWTGEMK